MVFPTQIATWEQSNVAADSDGHPQYFQCLKATEDGHRLLAREAQGRGVIAVVDFATSAVGHSGRFYAWGVGTELPRPVSNERLLTALDPRRGSGFRWAQGGPRRLYEGEAERIADLAGGLPAPRAPDRVPTRRDAKVIWTGDANLPPEVLIEEIVASKVRVWRRLGFSEGPVRQVVISSEDRPDLLAPGVVGEVKNRIRADWGPGQMERYLKTLDRERPGDAPWRGVLIHGFPTLTTAARRRLDGSPERKRIAVWSVEAAPIAGIRAKRLYP